MPRRRPSRPIGIRLPLTPEGRNPALAAEADYVKGRVEIQDEGSQLAALLSAAKPGEQVLDLCAGAGGKTLALAALMQNKGRSTPATMMAAVSRRSTSASSGLAPATSRSARRAGAMTRWRISPAPCDLVLIDAPCTGTGAWRRNPDAKWRIRPGALEQRIADQDQTLAAAARFVKPQGRILYATCSLLREENEDRIGAFLAANPAFQAVPGEAMVAAAGLPRLAAFASTLGPGVRLSPAASGTDGFFIALLTRENG